MSEFSNHDQYDKPPFPDLALRVHEVAVGDYRLLEGTEEVLPIDGCMISLLEPAERSTEILPGVRIVGSCSIGTLREPVVSFLYHKLGSDGQLETDERVIVYRGVGYGTHPGHTGQAPSWYIVGPQVGTIDGATGGVAMATEPGSEIAAKHFSLDCIVGASFGHPVLANPVH